ncbi:MAG: aminopeptidase N [Nannocystaceae bacterium]
MTTPRPIYRKDYTPPSHWIDTVDLQVSLGEESTTVQATLAVRQNPDNPGVKALKLLGEEMELLRVTVDGRELTAADYVVDATSLTLLDFPARATLVTEVRIKPQENTALSGLYRSGGTFCTQCEAEGFRRITYFLDRPDVMATYTTTIVGDATRYPVMLSNGNPEARGTTDEGLTWVRWVDPFPKPSYLFALVAGDLRCHPGAFTTMSGREVRLEIWVEPQNIDRCEHALRSLQKSMTWDEQTFGREYDLDIYMIVAVSDFNMGAMENKGLNVFNSKYVLALPETATDDDYEAIESVIAHEYFHNWTGNRVTCRDWFQLTLKEGLTVYRDRRFTADMTSDAIKRIADVRGLRLVQFAEDAGPMAHPIRPESYIEMNNFYTATVYEKGAEIIGMYEAILGRDGFRKGMDLYFERHDGQAVTCDDFRAAMADANAADLELFGRWYSQKGTPIVRASHRFDAKAQCYELTLEQHAPSTVDAADYLPMHIPVRMGLLGPDGHDLPLCQTEGATQGPTCVVLNLKQATQTFRFYNIEEAPVASLLRGFSAPVKLEYGRSREELSFLMAHDGDAFNRWEAGQTLATQLLLELAEAWAAEKPLVLDPGFVDAFAKILADPKLDGSLKSMAMTLPAERQLAQMVDVVNVDALHAARNFMRRELAQSLREPLWAAYRNNHDSGPYSPDGDAIDRRSLKNVVLGYLASLGTAEATAAVYGQFCQANNMTDAQAALVVLANMDVPERLQALEAFHAKWRHDPLVIDKWFAIQAGSSRASTLENVRALLQHPDFTLKNPNRARSLLGVFGAANQVRFHSNDGAGYALLADQVLLLDAMNPSVAARVVRAFNHWRRFDAGRQAAMKAQLERIVGHAGLSRDVYEIVSRALAPIAAGG